MSVTTFAAIDVGSYEVEMVIYEISTHGIRQLDHVRHIIALGRDTYNMKAISYDLVDELCEVSGLGGVGVELVTGVRADAGVCRYP